MSFFTFVSTRLHPLIFYLLAFLLGIATSSLLSPLMVILAVVCISTIIFFLGVYKFITRKIVIFLSFLCVSFITGQIRYFQVYNKYLTLQKIITNKTASCTGWVTSIEPNYSNNYFKWCTCITLNTITAGSQSYNVNTYIKFYTGKRPLVAIDDFIKLDSLYSKPSANKSYEDYLIKENILATIFLPELKTNLITSSKYSLNKFVTTIKNRVYNSLILKINKTTQVLFCSIFLGTKTRSKNTLDTIKRQFTQWGIVHYLARSGLHVALIVFLWLFLLKCIPLHFMLKQVIILLLIIIYTLLTVSSVSFARAFIAFLFYKFCIFKSLPISALQVITLTCFSILFYNPLQLFFLDFQLSFSLTYALIVFNDLVRLRQHVKYES